MTKRNPKKLNDMLDYKKLREDFTRVLNSYSDEEFYEWVDSYNQRMALIEEEERRDSQAARPPRSSAKLNGSPILTVEELNLEPVEA